MKTYIALFRGINVGGKNKLPMKELVALLTDLGCHNVRTYIQSGNAVFQTEEQDVLALAGQISAGINEQRGFEPYVLVLELEEFQQAIADNPYPEAQSEPKSLHLGFLSCAPENPDLSRLESLKSDSERFHLLGKVFYLHTPEGLGRSKLAANAERGLGVPMTLRNWRTVGKIWDLASPEGEHSSQVS